MSAVARTWGARICLPPPCHCEERSDGTIRTPCGSTKRKAILWANTQLLRICPKDCQLAKFLCGDADCHTSAIQAAHPSPRLFRRKSQVSAAPLHRLLRAAQVRPGSHFALVRNDMLKAARCQRLQERGARGYASPPCHCAGQSDGTIPTPCGGPWGGGLEAGGKISKKFTKRKCCN